MNLACNNCDRQYKNISYHTSLPSGESIVDCFNIAGSLSYGHIGAALHADLLFDLSLDEDILNNLDHWFNLQTFGMGILVSTEDLPLWDIVVTASHRGFENLILAILFVAQFLMVGFSGLAVLPCPLMLVTFCLWRLSPIHTLT